jgi:hypothetical protein
MLIVIKTHSTIYFSTLIQQIIQTYIIYTTATWLITYRYIQVISEGKKYIYEKNLFINACIHSAIHVASYT